METSKRNSFHVYLKNTLPLGVSVYYQAPTTSMSYPAVVYSVNELTNIMANNDKFMEFCEFKVVAMSTNIEDVMFSKLDSNKFSRRVSSYSKDGVHHVVYFMQQQQI